MYNCEKYISEAIYSVLNQTYPNFELIIIDDGCKDGSVDVVKRFMKDGRVRLIRQENKGLFHTRLVGLDNAVNEYCVFLDSDDTLETQALEKLNSLIKSKSPDVIIYRLRRIWNDGRIEDCPILFNEENFIEKESLLKELYSDNRINNLVVKAFKKELIQTDLLYDLPRITLGEDSMFTVEIFEHAEMVYYIKDIFYNYRMLDGSMSRSFDINAYKSNLIISRRLIDSAYHNNLLYKYEQQIIYRYFKKIANIVLFGKYKIKENKNNYMIVLETIYNDEFFRINYKKFISKMPIVIRITMFLIYKRMKKTIFMIKCMIEPLMLKR